MELHDNVRAGGAPHPGAKHATNSGFELLQSQANTRIAEVALDVEVGWWAVDKGVQRLLLGRKLPFECRSRAGK
jgi:hypothetical protein